MVGCGSKNLLSEGKSFSQVGFGEFRMNFAVPDGPPSPTPSGSDGSRFQAGPEQLRPCPPLEALMKGDGDEWLRLKAFWR